MSDLLGYWWIVALPLIVYWLFTRAGQIGRRNRGQQDAEGCGMPELAGTVAVLLLSAAVVALAVAVD